jgi:hypothetical protein
MPIFRIQVDALFHESYRAFFEIEANTAEEAREIMQEEIDERDLDDAAFVPIDGEGGEYEIIDIKPVRPKLTLIKGAA